MVQYFSSHVFISGAMDKFALFLFSISSFYFVLHFFILFRSVSFFHCSNDCCYNHRRYYLYAFISFRVYFVYYSYIIRSVLKCYFVFSLHMFCDYSRITSRTLCSRCFFPIRYWLPLLFYGILRIVMF